jgi:Fe-S-cluster-containing dehydrogenase component
LPPVAPSSGIELVIRPDQTILDGHFSNNGWMQELPKQLTKITWDNAALMSPATAAKLNLIPSSMLLESDQLDAKVVEIKAGTASVKAPVQVIAGHPDDVITLNLGYGRTRAGQLGSEIGANAYALRTVATLGSVPNVQVSDTGTTYALSHTRAHYSMEKRDIVMEATLEEFLKKPDFAKTESTTDPPKELNIYAEAQEKDHKYEGFGAYKWGMSIDNNVCIGCQACVTACQAENNIPIVGKDQVTRGREMHWIRVDRYYKGDLKNPQTFFEPVPCMHCELAPCEPVCPVAATTHSHEGLNQMIYNRCVGTKYCSDNCPYKVRRFNFYKYSAGQPWRPGTNYDLPVLKLAANPEVTIRGRGVMEKCTYCVQRIDAARQTAKVEGREIRDGEVVTACQQACPTNAIVFGNVNDKESAVSKLKAQPHDYSLLGELGTRPRTTYLAKLSNPNPDIRSQRGTERE